jgi:hypothetical protein
MKAIHGLFLCAKEWRQPYNHSARAAITPYISGGRIILGKASQTNIDLPQVALKASAQSA